MCVAILVTVSLLTQAPAPEKVRGITYGTAEEGEVGADEHAEPAAMAAADAGDGELGTAGWRRVDLWLTVGLLLGVAALWLYFS